MTNRFHLRRAVETSPPLAKMDCDRCAAYAALECLVSAVLFVGANGCVVHMNGAAAEMIAARDGLELSRNRLRAATIEASREMFGHFHAAATCCSSRAGTVVLPRPSGRRPLFARIYPLSAGGRFMPPEGALSAMFVADPELRPHEPISHVARAYGLTKAEARLLARLIDSATLLHAADALAVTEATARTLLGRIFAKTNTLRQAELVRLVFVTKPPTRPD